MTPLQSAALDALVAWAQAPATRLRASHGRMNRQELDLLVAAERLKADALIASLEVTP